MSKRKRRQHVPRTTPMKAPAPPPPAAVPVLEERVVRERTDVTERLSTRTCAWCGDLIEYAGRGRRPTYCGQPCRQRAHEARTADRRTSAVVQPRPAPVQEVVVRTETVTRTVHLVPQPVYVEWRPATVDAWVAQLQQLVAQLRDPAHPMARQHWQHARLLAALQAAAGALGDAHPGGIDRLSGR